MPSPSSFVSMARLFLAMFILFSFILLHFEQGGITQAAPLSIRKASANTQFFKNLIYSGVGFNRTMMYHKDDVTSELVDMLRNNPDSVLNSHNPRNNTIDHS